MAINVSQPFHRTSAGPIDDSLNLSKAQMLTVNDNLMPSKWFTVCADDGQFYLYDKSNEPDEETGKFRLYQSEEMPAEDMDEVVDPLPSVSPSPIATSGDATVVSDIVSSGTIKWYRTGDVVQVVLTNCVFTSDSERNTLICSGLPDPITTSCPCIQTIDNNSYLINVYSNNGEGRLSKGGATQITNKTVYSTFTYIAK